MFTNIESFDPKDFILVKGAKVNNLKNIDVVIPRNQFVVITGLSGSGKSSFAFDTLFAEGQRMYVESLSSYARQFLGRMEKPDVEYIKGIAPAIAVEQKGNTKNPRATVGTTTEIYDYLKLLYARIGKTFSPISGQIVKKNTVSDVVNFVHSLEESQKINILTPFVLHEERSLEDELKIIFQKGFSRILVKDNLIFIEDFLRDSSNNTENLQDIFILVDRNVVRKEDEDNQYRIADSIQTAFYEGRGICVIDEIGNKKYFFSDKFELDGITFEEPSVQFFSFNNPYGACKRCGGFGSVLDIDENLVIPDKSLSVYEGAVVAWKGEKMQEWKNLFIQKAVHFDFPIHRAYQDLNEKEKNLLWNGNKEVEGIFDFFRYVESQNHKIQYRVMMARYRGKIICPDCKGTRLRKDAQYVKINDKSITDLMLMSIERLLEFLMQLELSQNDEIIARRILTEIQNRVSYLSKVGLGYLTLNRLTASLSGGEYQRIKLATALGSALVGSMYILDEPSIGLHPRDTTRLIGVLKDLKDLGNTVIVVEHEEEIMQAADQIIDIGPEAGSQGGDLVFNLSHKELIEQNDHIVLEEQYSTLNEKYSLQNSYTYQFLKGIDMIEIPKQRRKWVNYIEIKGARQNNLKNIHVKFPLNILTVVTGVSGSGKSTLIKNILYPVLAKYLHINSTESVGSFDKLDGDLSLLKHIEFIDQNPIGKSSRSNPATYTKVYDHIRTLFAEQNLARSRGYDAGFFSFNADKGRCETCQGEGKIRIEMQFMADVHLTCESCKGKRFKREILDIKYKEKDISEVLEMTIDDSITFFRGNPRIINAIKPLSDVGLGYVRLGQSSNTLSGGEAQRLKLASFLKAKTEKTLFIFDEPTTGLHFNDIKKLLKAIQALIEQGNAVIIIEHNLEVIKSADWIIDLGPEGGENGGNICFEGTPEQMVTLQNNHTAHYLKEKLLLSK